VVGEDMVSQEEIDALLHQERLQEDTETPLGLEETLLTKQETQALMEFGSVLMGDSEKTLANILGRKVGITSPVVKNIDLVTFKSAHAGNCVIVEVGYISGLKGTHYLLMKEQDVKTITDLMMGGDGSNASSDITELHLSAIGEAVNQMMGSASVSLSKLCRSEIDISSPNTKFFQSKENDWDWFGLKENEVHVWVQFHLTVEGLIESEIFQLQTLPFARAQAHVMMQYKGKDAKSDAEKSIPSKTGKEDITKNSTHEEVAGEGQANLKKAKNFALDAIEDPQNFGKTQVESDFSWEERMQNQSKAFRDVQSVQFQSVDEGKMYLDKKNVDLILDVPLQVTVELGRTRRLIKEVIELGSGSIVELDKIAEEPVDILVNGKIIAKGEVVVIDDNFGVRITEIIQTPLRV
jgi:flagellar motor switch protein FliN